MKKLAIALLVLATLNSCKTEKETTSDKLTLMTLDPGHFHASLIQKSMLPGIDSVCYVYAPKSLGVSAHNALLNEYNIREDNPTGWKVESYTDSDFLEKMLEEKPGNIVVLAGNNKRKTDYIHKSVSAALNVLSDKPMAINKEGFNLLIDAFDVAKEKQVLLYDIMTERYNIFSILQKELVHNADLFGTLEKGTIDNPAIIKNSVHHFYKEVSGKPLIRPDWYYDVEQEGEGIVDVTTHSIDLIQWQLFPENVFDYKADVEVLNANRYPTKISLEQFEQSTGDAAFPGFLQKDVKNDTLNVYANGEINYSLKGVHSKVAVQWNYQAPEGSGDTHLSQIRGTRSIVSIKQGKEQNYKPRLYIEPAAAPGFTEDDKKAITAGFETIANKYKGIALKPEGNGYVVEIPADLLEGHEEHFAHVANKFFDYVRAGEMPEWEKSFMLTKYYITTEALAKAKTLR
ncbi:MULTISPECIES: putative oxidoreductase C-terminal domain-containing protein [Sphingobacterium]|uniref:Oxidoreductase n=1 Tax=Sphingobacterium hotanense TaxID=649196 RepID=A0ABT7NHY3_9SPHI|nr:MULTISPECIES: putative oxidoreductase C-terminal domain-containing protein [Sphingobacterium]MDM1046799.1 oxidoreductase [Sphingobacterium hotanense]